MSVAVWLFLVGMAGWWGSVVRVLLSVLLWWDGEWDARAALPGVMGLRGLVVLGGLLCGVCCLGWPAVGMAWVRWMGFGWVRGFGGLGLWLWAADEPESLILAQSERWRHA